jgi:hypothetical protein
LPDGSEIRMQDYFDGTNASPCASGPGVGHIETVTLADDPSVDLAQAKGLLGCTSGAASLGATSSGDTQGVDAHKPAGPRDVPALETTVPARSRAVAD